MEKLRPILKKLQPVLDHLEKIILGGVLIAVATISVLKLLEARKTIIEVGETTGDIQLSGSDYEVDPLLKKNFNELIAQASGSPVPLVLEGSNHMVFNPRKWKEIISTETGGSQVTNLVQDSVTNKLGISALTVTNIYPLQLIVTPIAMLSPDKTKVLYRFHQFDQYPMQFNPDPRLGFLTTFIGHQPMGKPYSKRLTFVANRGLVDLHAFTKENPAYLQKFHPDWIVKIDFKGVTPPVSPENVDSVFFNLDVVYRNPGPNGHPATGNTVTNKYPRVRSKSPIGINRAYAADFRFKTKYHALRGYRGYRVGRHIMMDGEALIIKKITPNEVWLYSDLEFGGNGKLYKKKWIQPGAANPAGVNQPIPGAIPVPPPKK